MASPIHDIGDSAFIIERQPAPHVRTHLKQGKKMSFGSSTPSLKRTRPMDNSEPLKPPGVSSSVSRRREIRFANPKTQDRFTPRQYRPGERPAKQVKAEKCNKHNGEMLLTARRPIKVYVPTDTWQLILQRCDLAFLLKARLVCRAFRDLLDRQALWRDARKYSYGDEIPDCPQHITEFRYANLLVGRGCQIEPCTRKDTRKVFWPFALRMCEKCFHQVTALASTDHKESRLYSDMYLNLPLELREAIPSNLWDLLPAGRLDSGRWVGPRLLDMERDIWKRNTAPSRVVVLADSYENLRFEFAEDIQNNPDKFLSWATSKWEVTKGKMIWSFQMNKFGLSGSLQPCDLRDQKIKLFQQKALELNPPMYPEMLEKFAAYHSAIETQNAASTRSWDLLKMKVEDPELRAQAVNLLEWPEADLEWDSSDSESPYEKLSKHRGSMYRFTQEKFAEEQLVVIDIAEEELNKLIDVVHDEDILLMLLDNVRRTYESLEEKPEGMNIDGKVGMYELSLDDARVVVKYVLHNRLKNMTLERYNLITASLRCMGCSMSKFASTYNFVDLLNHARRTHANFVAKDAHWYKLALPMKGSDRWSRHYLAWLGQPWFKSFPALPNHQKPTPGMVWNPDIETEYVQHPGTKLSLERFDDFACNHNTKIPADDFTSNFCRAVRTLVHTRLEPRFIIKIALEYAMRRQQAHKSMEATEKQITVEMIQNLETICAKISTKMEFKFPCKLCVLSAAKAKRKHRTRPPRPYPFSFLIPHWRNIHYKDMEVCFLDRVVMPSDTEVMATIFSEDKKLEADKSVYRRRSDRNNDTADPRATALLETPSIQSCFDKLFTRLSEEDESS